jgi:putative Ca2+/H+ antiporter (TMEM165/GDT1 family)
MEAFFVSALVVAISEIADKTQLLSLFCCAGCLARRSWLSRKHARRAVRRRAFRPRRQRAARCDSSQVLRFAGAGLFGALAAATLFGIQLAPA